MNGNNHHPHVHVEEPDLNLNTTSLGNEMRRRTPWMLLALCAGAAMVVIGERFQSAFAGRLELVFFLPMIVFMSDAIGTETMALFVRELALRRVSLKHLFWKEVFVGLYLGLLTGIPMALFSYVLFRDADLSCAIAFAMLVNGLVAVLMGMLIPMLFARFKEDPALGTEQIGTAISDIVSLLVYLAIASLILF